MLFWSDIFIAFSSMLKGGLVEMTSIFFWVHSPFEDVCFSPQPRWHVESAQTLLYIKLSSVQNPCWWLMISSKVILPLILLGDSNNPIGKSLVPFGKLSHNYGKIHQFFMGKLTISTGPFSMSQTVSVYQRVTNQYTVVAKSCTSWDSYW